MNIHVPAFLSALELLGTVQICQALQRQGQEVVVGVEDPNDVPWFTLACLTVQDCNGSGVTLAYDKTYRQFEGSNEFYFDLLAKNSQLSVDSQPVRFPSFPVEREAIVIAPFGARDLLLDIAMWRLVARALRTYALPVVTLCQAGQRVDLAGFPESDIFADCMIEEKLSMLSNAKLLIGVPNEWTLSAVHYRCPMVVLCPEDVVKEKWFPYLSDEQPFRLLAYPRGKLEAAALVTGLRFLIERL